MFRGTHETIFLFFASAKISKIRLLGAAPNPPARAACAALRTLHEWSGYAPWRALNTGRFTGWEVFVPLWLEASVGRVAAPSGVTERTAVVALFRGLGSSAQQAFCRSVYTPALLATIVFGGIGIPAAHETSPGMR